MGTLPKRDIVRYRADEEVRGLKTAAAVLEVRARAVQRSPSTVSKVRTSNRSVASVRYSRTSSQASKSVSASVRAFRIDGCHACQSLGMASRWAYRANVERRGFRVTSIEQETVTINNQSDTARFSLP